jgi:hypothetical protein
LRLAPRVTKIFESRFGLRVQMGLVFRRTAGSTILALGAFAFFGCTTPPEKPPSPPPPVAVAPQPPKSVMFDSDPNGEWNIFPDPTSGDVGVYHKGNYLGSVDGHEDQDPPLPHPKAQPDSDDAAPDGYR